MSIRENIIKLRKIYGITQEDLAKIADVSRGAVSQWEGGFSEPRMGAIERIVDHFGIRKSHIIEDGGMDDIDPVTKKPKVHTNTVGMPMGYVPLVGSVHAGKPVEPDVVDGELVKVPQFLIDSDPDCYALEAEGDCMNRVYPEGCTVVVSPNKEPQNGSVAVVTVDGHDAVMRRMYRTPNTLILSPDSFNKEHTDIIITSDTDHTIEFLGKVVWFQSADEME